MPLYQYECEKCGERFDIRQKFVDSPLTVHEDCGGSVHRLLSAPALQFKGSGFYITDYAKNSSSQPGNGSSKKGDSASGGEKSESSKSESSKSESSKGEKAESSKKESSPAATESKSSSPSDTK